MVVKQSLQLLWGTCEASLSVGEKRVGYPDALELLIRVCITKKYDKQENRRHVRECTARPRVEVWAVPVSLVDLVQLLGTDLRIRLLAPEEQEEPDGPALSGGRET